MMRVELQRIAFSAVALLKRVSGPAGALRHHVRHVDQFDLRAAIGQMLNGPIAAFFRSPFAEALPPELAERFLRCMLPTDRNAQPIRPRCLVDQIEQSEDQLRIAIACDLHEDRVRRRGR